MRMIDHVNLDNTFHSLNFNAYLSKDTHKLHSNNKQELDKMKQLIYLKEADNYTFIIEDNMGYQFLQKAIASGAYVKYIIDNEIPVSVLFLIGNCSKLELVYKYRKAFDHKLLKNMDTARQILRVGILYNYHYKEDDIVDFLFAMNDTRYIAERVYIDFENDNVPDNLKVFYKDNELKTTYKLQVFSGIHEPLARWHVQVHLSANSKASMADLRKQVLSTNKVRGFQ